MARFIPFLILTVILSQPSLLLAQNDLERRVADLEARVAVLEEFVARLEEGVTERENAVPPISTGTEPISAALFKKGFEKGQYGDYITFEFMFTNNLEKAIRAFTGIVVFLDLFDREIYRVTLTIEESVEPGSWFTWKGNIEYNQFLTEHQRLRSIDKQDLQTRFELEAVVFQDGTKRKF